MTNEELQENIAYIKRNAIGNVKALNINVPALLALIAKVESLAADAERYQWLKKTANMEMVKPFMPGYESIDNAIDDRMAKEKA